MLTLEQQAKIIGCTVDQCRQQHIRNAEQLESMARTADATGKKVNGYTAAQLRQSAAKHRTIANS